MASNDQTVRAYETGVDDYLVGRKPEDSREYCRWIVRALKECRHKTTRIFEIGSGPGYDADYLESIGYAVDRSDVVDGFLQINQERGKEIVKFNVLRDEFPAEYDAILAVNVMQHFNSEEFKMVLVKIYNALHVEGRFLFTITLGGHVPERRHGMMFMNWDEKQLLETLHKYGFEIDRMNSIGYRNWYSGVAIKRESSLIV